MKNVEWVIGTEMIIYRKIEEKWSEYRVQWSLFKDKKIDELKTKKNLSSHSNGNVVQILCVEYLLEQKKTD